MQKRICSFIVAIAMVFTLFSTPLVASAAENTTVPEGYVVLDSGNVEISSAEGLRYFASQVNEGNNFNKKTVKLTKDINLNNEPWTPIGKSGKAFTGTFDGGKNTISNLFIERGFSNSAANSYVGLFGYTLSPAVIKDVTVENARIQGSLYVGVIAGRPYTGNSISNCHVKGDIKVDAYWYAGGIAGEGYINTIEDCSVIGKDGSYIKGNGGSYMGGIMGFRGEGGMKIDNCEVINIDISGDDRVGGISGMLHYGNSILNSKVLNVSIKANDPKATTVGLIAGATQGNDKNNSVIKNNTVLETVAKIGDKVVTDEYGTDIDGNTAVVAGKYVAKIGDKEYVSVDAAIKEAQSGDVVQITKPGQYKPFTLKDGITVKGIIGKTVEESTVIKSTNTTAILLNGKDAKLDSLIIDSSDRTKPTDPKPYEGSALVYVNGKTENLTIDNCKLIGGGEGTTALYYHAADIKVTNSTFENFGRAYYVCGDNEAMGKITFEGNTFTNVKVPLDVYWGKPVAKDSKFVVKNNTINTGSYETSYVQFWDYAQYQYWLNGANSKLNPEGKTALNVEMTGNTFNGKVKVYATHANWFSDSNINLGSTEKANLVNRKLVEIKGKDVEKVTVSKKDGSKVTEFNETTSSSSINGKTVIYTLSEGEYLLTITHKSEDGDKVVTQSAVTVVTPVGEKTQEVEIKPVTETAIAEVIDADGNKTEYKSVEKAIKEAKAGSTVNILSNVSVDTWNQLGDKKDITINGNGHKITINKLESNGNGNYLIYSGRNITVKDLTVELPKNASGFDLVSGEISKVTIIGGRYGVITGPTEDKGVTIKDSHFEGMDYAIYTEENGKAANTVIQNNTFDSVKYVAILRNNEKFDNNIVNDGKITISEATGTVTGNTFAEDTTVKLYDNTSKIEKNKFLGKVDASKVSEDNNVKLDKNFWGENRKPADVLGENAGKLNAENIPYYVTEEMDRLNTDKVPVEPEKPAKPVDPKLAGVKGIKTYINGSKKTFTIKFSAVAKADNYTVAYKKNGAKKWTYVSTNGKRSYKMKLKAGDTIETRVCANKTVSGKKFRSNYSSSSYRMVGNHNVKSVLSYSKKNLALSWAKAKNNYKGAKLYYHVAYRTNNGKFKVKAVSANKMNLKVVAGKYYQVKVRPVIKVGSKKYIGSYEGKYANRYAKSTYIKSLRAGKKQLKVTMSKATGTTGYQVVYATNKSFKGQKYYTNKGASKVKRTISKLKSGKRYYVKVRTYKQIKGMKYYGPYSKTLSLKAW